MFYFLETLQLYPTMRTKNVQFFSWAKQWSPSAHWVRWTLKKQQQQQQRKKQKLFFSFQKIYNLIICCRSCCHWMLFHHIKDKLFLLPARRSWIIWLIQQVAKAIIVARMKWILWVPLYTIFLEGERIPVNAINTFHRRLIELFKPCEGALIQSVQMASKSN